MERETQRLARGSVGWMQLTFGVKVAIIGLWWLVCLVAGFLLGYFT